MDSLPLSGLTVVALEQAVAAPFTTRQLADYGARVIKIERPGTGDFARHYDETVHGLSSHFVWINRGKESLTLDLKSVAGQDIVRRLMARADILVQNLKPGALERMGLGAELLREQYPRLIICSISGYGPDGPYRDKKAYDLLIQAESGILSITGTPESPAKVGISVADIAAGMYALTGVLMAVVERQKTGRGTHIEVSMLEALAEWMGFPLNYGHFSGRPPARTGPHHATIAPYGPYPARDGEVFVAVQNEREWQLFCRSVLGRDDMAQDERFSTNSLRVTNREALNQAISEAFARHSAAELIQLLDRAQIASARLNQLNEIWNHPQLRSRWAQVGTERGPVPQLRPPVNFPQAVSTMGAVPALGQHTWAILKELGIPESDITAWEQDGTI